MPFVDALLVLDESTPPRSATTGEFTHRLVNTERDVKRFWDIQSADILLLAMKGTMLQADGSRSYTRTSS